MRCAKDKRTSATTEARVVKILQRYQQSAARLGGGGGGGGAGFVEMAASDQRRKWPRVTCVNDRWAATMYAAYVRTKGVDPRAHWKVRST